LNPNCQPVSNSVSLLVSSTAQQAILPGKQHSPLREQRSQTSRAMQKQKYFFKKVSYSAFQNYSQMAVKIV